jgi:hypothetical protein
MKMNGQLHDPVAFTPRERASGIHWIGGWVGPRTGLDTVVKRKIPSPCWDSNHRSSIPQSSAITLSYPGSLFLNIFSVKIYSRRGHEQKPFLIRIRG